MNVREKISEVIRILNEIDNYESTLNDSMSLVDSKICDFMHLIENKTLKTAQYYRVIRELRNLRLERRRIKNDMELIRTYKANDNKMLNQNNRQFLLSDLGKREKQLNYPYKNRVYTEEEIKEMVGE